MCALPPAAFLRCCSWLRGIARGHAVVQEVKDYSLHTVPFFSLLLPRCSLEWMLFCACGFAIECICFLLRSSSRIGVSRFQATSSLYFGSSLCCGVFYRVSSSSSSSSSSLQKDAKRWSRAAGFNESGRRRHRAHRVRCVCVCSSVL